MALTSCTDDDSFTMSRANLLSFSTDTLRMDTVFSRVPTSTKTFWVYNKSGNGIRCTNVRLSHGNQSGFRVNVDGVYLSSTSGYQTSGVEVRDKDSIRVFVELTAPVNGKDEPQLHVDELIFTLESGVEQKIPLSAYTWDALMCRNIAISRDSVIDNRKPIIIYGGMTIDSLATLRISAGTTIYFHADAGIDVYGKLITEGSPEKNVTLRGDRMDRMFDNLPYDRLSGQWKGITLHESSYGNNINYTDIHGTFNGIVCDSSDVSKMKLLLQNSTVHNCQGYGLKAVNGMVEIRNTQISNTLNDCVYLLGGNIQLLHCTIAQFYPFDSKRGNALHFANSTDKPLLKMDCINSIVTGYADNVISVTKEDSTVAWNYRFISSLLRTPKKEESDTIQNVIWENVEDTASVSGQKNFKKIDISSYSPDYCSYDFRLDRKSPAIGKANPLYTLPEDRNGIPRNEEPDMGAYEFYGTDD